MYFLKPIGTSEEPVRPYDVFNVEKENLFFSKKPNQIRQKDILLVYGVGISNLIGVYEVTSKTKSITEEHIKEGFQKRWPWYVETINLTKNFTKVWWEYDLKLNQLTKEYQEKYPNEKLTLTGAKNLNALRFGWDKLAVMNNFGEYIFNRIQKY